MDKSDEQTLKDFYGYINTVPNKQDFIDYINDCIKKAQGDIGWEFLGFIDDYINLSKLIPKELIVVDVGCAYGFQHIIFKDHKGYIGIDGGGINRVPKTFTKNVKFIKGKFKDVISKKKLVITDDMFGVDNMSLLYAKDNKSDIKLFNNIFKRKYNR